MGLSPREKLLLPKIRQVGELEKEFIKHDYESLNSLWIKSPLILFKASFMIFNIVIYPSDI